MKPLTQLQIQLLQKFKHLRPRDFPLTQSDKLLAAQIRKNLAGADNRAIARFLLK